MVALIPNTPPVAVLERETLTDEWDYPDDRVSDARGRPAAIYAPRAALAEAASRTAVPAGILSSMDFPTSLVLRVAADEINKDVRDELQYKFRASALEIARVRKYTEFDRIAARAVAALGIKGLDQDIYVTNNEIDAFKAIIHEPMDDALHQAGLSDTFVLDHSHCSRTEVWGRAKRIIAAARGRAHQCWDETYP